MSKLVLDLAKEITEARDSEIPDKLLKLKGSIYFLLRFFG